MRAQRMAQYALVLLLLAASSLSAATYEESFNATTYRDPASTAVWDAVAGEIRLPVYEAVEIAHVATAATSSANEIAVVGDILFVADATAGLKTFDVSDPSSPVLLAAVSTIANAMQVKVRGDYAYIVAREGGLLIYNISDPSHPFSVSQYDTPDYAYGIDVVGDYAFIGNRTDGLYIIDISDPYAPTFVASEPAGFHGRFVQVVGDYAYNAGGSFDIFDVSDISNPIRVATLDTPDLAQDLRIVGNVAYVADYNGGFLVIDISNPAAPYLLAHVDTPYIAYAVEVTGDVAFILQQGGPLLIFDVSDPSAPVQIGAGVTSTYGLGLKLAGEYLYAANFTQGVKIHRVFGIVEGEINADANLSQSLRVDDGSVPWIGRARFSAVQTGTFAWELSADGGASWQSFAPGADWVDFAAPGTQLLWRCRHLYQGDGVNPTCGHLVIEYEAPQPELVAWLSLDDDASDQSGTGIDAVAYGGVSFAHACGAGFDGIDDYIEYPFNSVHQPARSLTVSSWVLYDALNPGQALHQIVNDSNYAPAHGYYLALDSSARVKFRIMGNGGQEAVLSPDPLTPGVWHHLAGVFDGDKLRLYVDGASWEYDTASTAMSYEPNHLRLGYHATNSLDYFRGLIDEVRVYDGALSDDEIQALFAMGGSCEYVNVAGILSSDCEEPIAGVAVQLVDGNGDVHTAETDAQGAYQFAAVPASAMPGLLSVAPIGGYTFVSPAGGTVNVPLDADQTVDFALACIYVTVGATVQSDCLGLMQNMTVDLFDGVGGFHTGYTNAAGSIVFPGIRWSPDGGELSIVVPEGFAPVTPPDGHVLVDLTGDSEVGIALACLTPVEDARGMGYWKHQAKVYESGNGSAQESEQDMGVTFPTAIFNRFYQNELNGIDVEGVTYRLEGGAPVPLDLETILATLSVKGNSGMLARAKQHYLALLLNVASHKLESHSLASEDGKTVSQAIQWVSAAILDGDSGNDEQAKDIAETLNEGLHVAAGVIPDDLPYVPYIWNTDDAVPAIFAMSQNYPNPFNPSTMIKLAMPQAASYELKVVDVSGRLIRDLSGVGGPGVVSVVWDGRDRNGAAVASGVYFYEAHACEESIRMKMHLVK